MRSTSVTATPLKIGTLRRLAATHPYFARWSLEQLRGIEDYCQLVSLAPGARLLELGDMSAYEFFLLEGRLALRAGDGGSRTVVAGELDAGFPVAHLRPSKYAVAAAGPARLLRVEASRLRRLHGPSAARFRVDGNSIGGSWRAHPLVAAVLQRLRRNELEVPSVPNIALRIRRALERDQQDGLQDMASIARIIGADPAIAGRLVRAANSALFQGRTPCDSVQAALVRLGVQRVQNLVLTIASKSLFTARAPHLKERMMKRWRHAIDIAALCAVLGKLTPGLDGDRGLLMGLVHEIGVLPVLKLAGEHPDLIDRPELLDEILDGLVPEVSAAVLERWGFEPEFIVAARNQTNWYWTHEGAAGPAGADYTDVLVVAHLHALVKERHFHRLPRIDETPAFQRLAVGLLSPQLSLLVLDEAKGQIQELRALLS